MFDYIRRVGAIIQAEARSAMSEKQFFEMDLVLLCHEKYEYELMILQGLDYRETHELAEAQYNYARYVKELDEKE